MKLTLFIFASMLILVGCQNKNNTHTQNFDQLQKSLVTADSSFVNSDVEQVAVYYFHATRRCATCQAVESTTEEALQEYFGDKVSFVSINREENSEHPLIAEHKINGQTLLIIKGDSVVNLTNDAFLNARTQPEKLKEKLKSTIESL